jgi:GTPase SAR1 family protein
MVRPIVTPLQRSAPGASQWLRWLAAAAVLLATFAGLHALLGLVDSTVLFWQRLQELPLLLSGALAAAALALIGVSGWLMWRLLRPRRQRVAQIEPIERPRIESRIEALGEPAAVLTEELRELDRRRQADIVQVALFGEISSGKSSLLRALAPDSSPSVGVVGGTTRQVLQARGLLPDGRSLQVADVPGSNESGGEGRAALARDEAARAHALVFVADGDLTRSQDAELRQLLACGRPLVLALNKSDRYREDERDTLLQRLRQRYPGPQVQVVAISAGGTETVQREFPDGRVEHSERALPTRIAPLQKALTSIVARGTTQLEPAREMATLTRIDQRLTLTEIEQRQQQSDACVSRYTRRAVLGAMAAVAPGTDLLIQGALATAMIRELCAIHELPARDIDLDSLIARAGGSARNSTALLLAIAGNALKAFPGAGTLGGGLVHALAYGLIFDALGQAVAKTLASSRALDRDATLQAFAAQLAAPGRERLKALAGLAWDAARGNHDGGSTPSRAGSPHGR